MPKDAKQWGAILLIGGLSALSAGVAQNVSKADVGITGFVATILGGAVGATGAIIILGGHGAKLA